MGIVGNEIVGYSRDFGDTFSTFLKLYNTANLQSVAKSAKEIAQNTLRLREELKNNTSVLASGIEALGAQFNYGFTMMFTELQAQGKVNNDILKSLESIDETLRTPDATRAKEWIEKGNALLAKGLLDLALDSFLKSVEICNVNFLPHMQLGRLYLYGVDDEVDLTDADKAEEHFILAARLSKAEIEADSSFEKHCAECYFHAAISCYVRGNTAFGTDKKKEAQSFYLKAAKYADNASRHNPGFAEAIYHLAKLSCLLGDSDKGFSYLRKAIAIDSRYLERAENDSDMSLIRKDILGMKPSILKRDNEKDQQLLSVCEDFQKEFASVEKKFREEIHFYKEHVDSFLAKAFISYCVQYGKKYLGKRENDFDSKHAKLSDAKVEESLEKCLFSDFFRAVLVLGRIEGMKKMFSAVDAPEANALLVSPDPPSFGSKEVAAIATFLVESGLDHSPLYLEYIATGDKRWGNEKRYLEAVDQIESVEMKANANFKVTPFLTSKRIPMVEEMIRQMKSFSEKIDFILANKRYGSIAEKAALIKDIAEGKQNLAKVSESIDELKGSIANPWYLNKDWVVAALKNFGSDEIADDEEVEFVE